MHNLKLWPMLDIYIQENKGIVSKRVANKMNISLKRP